MSQTELHQPQETTGFCSLKPQKKTHPKKKNLVKLQFLMHTHNLSSPKDSKKHIEFQFQTRINEMKKKKKIEELEANQDPYLPRQQARWKPNHSCASSTLSTHLYTPSSLSPNPQPPLKNSHSGLKSDSPKPSSVSSPSISLTKSEL